MFVAAVVVLWCAASFPCAHAATYTMVGGAVPAGTYTEDTVLIDGAATLSGGLVIFDVAGMLTGTPLNVTVARSTITGPTTYLELRCPLAATAHSPLVATIGPGNAFTASGVQVTGRPPAGSAIAIMGNTHTLSAANRLGGSVGSMAVLLKRLTLIAGVVLTVAENTVDCTPHPETSYCVMIASFSYVNVIGTGAALSVSRNVFTQVRVVDEGICNMFFIAFSLEHAYTAPDTFLTTVADGGELAIDGNRATLVKNGTHSDVSGCTYFNPVLFRKYSISNLSTVRLQFNTIHISTLKAVNNEVSGVVAVGGGSTVTQASAFVVSDNDVTAVLATGTALSLAVVSALVVSGSSMLNISANTVVVRATTAGMAGALNLWVAVSGQSAVYIQHNALTVQQVTGGSLVRFVAGSQLAAQSLLSIAGNRLVYNGTGVAAFVALDGLSATGGSRVKLRDNDAGSSSVPMPRLALVAGLVCGGWPTCVFTACANTWYGQYLARHPQHVVPSIVNTPAVSGCSTRSVTSTQTAFVSATQSPPIPDTTTAAPTTTTTTTTTTAAPTTSSTTTSDPTTTTADPTATTPAPTTTSDPTTTTADPTATTTAPTTTSDPTTTTADFSANQSSTRAGSTQPSPSRTSVATHGPTATEEKQSATHDNPRTPSHSVSTSRTAFVLRWLPVPTPFAIPPAEPGPVGVTGTTIMTGVIGTVSSPIGTSGLSSIQLLAIFAVMDCQVPGAGNAGRMRRFLTPVGLNGRSGALTGSVIVTAGLAAVYGAVFAVLARVLRSQERARRLLRHPQALPLLHLVTLPGLAFEAAKLLYGDAAATSGERVFGAAVLALCCASAGAYGGVSAYYHLRVTPLEATVVWPRWGPAELAARVPRAVRALLVPATGWAEAVRAGPRCVYAGLRPLTPATHHAVAGHSVLRVLLVCVVCAVRPGAEWHCTAVLSVAGGICAAHAALLLFLWPLSIPVMNPLQAAQSAAICGVALIRAGNGPVAVSTAFTMILVGAALFSAAAAVAAFFVGRHYKVFCVEVSTVQESTVVDPQIATTYCYRDDQDTLTCAENSVDEGVCVEMVHCSAREGEGGNAQPSSFSSQCVDIQAVSPDDGSCVLPVSPQMRPCGSVDTSAVNALIEAHCGLCSPTDDN